ncbi:MAG: 50S ribosomal protein L15 [Gammaproteobacteria bacterium]|nr:50S ribosomal protein L15 [Gammaproteobacteria bacterium]MCH9744273.1 50S ribosomal protein L15 [Gammaproteobacteria bacterium]
MKLNTIKPSAGARKAKKRLGRGIGCGSGKTCGRGHKGQHSRSGGYHKVGFEGGQMPLQRRVPKFGFNSRKALVTSEIRLHELEKVTGDVVDIASLQKANVITSTIKFAKIIASGEIKKAVTIKGIRVTKGAKAAIEAAGGKVEE